MVALEQHRRELLPAPCIAAHRQRTERVAMIALPARDEPGPLGLATLDEILPRHLERCFDRLRATRHEVDLRNTGRRAIDEMIGQPLRRVRGEEGRVRVGQAVDLSLYGLVDCRMPVTQAGNGRTARGIDICLAFRIENLDAAAADRDGQACLGDSPVKNTAGAFGHALRRLVVVSVV